MSEATTADLDPGSTAAPAPATAARARDAPGRHAVLVAAGILLSRVVGLVRQRVFAHFLGSGVVAGVFSAALRIPNLLQNMLGEGILSSSFIPVYAHLLARGERDEADRVAGAMAGLLATAAALLSALGVVATPLLVDLVMPGLGGREHALAVRFVRILFPATATLVMSAWCLGILNSHRRFFLSYAAPVVNNVAVIVALLAAGRHADEARIGTIAAWGYMIGAVLQVAAQVPTVVALLGRFRPTLSVAGAHIRTVLRNFGPALVGRGVVQLSAFVDTIYASYVGTRALAILNYQQILYLLPISLFGMAISASELPAMSAAVGTPEAVAAALRSRLDAALPRLARFVIPSAAAFVLLGDVVAGALFQTGRQTAADTRYLWLVLAGSALGLLAATMGRLYSSAFYALRDTRTPLRFAIARLAITAVLAWWSALKMPAQLGVPRELGLVGITATTGVAAWLEYALLRRALVRRIGRTGLARGTFVRLWGAGIAAGAVALAVKLALVRWRGPAPGLGSGLAASILPAPRLYPPLAAVPVLGAFGLTYAAIVLRDDDGIRRLLRRVLVRR